MESSELSCFVCFLCCHWKTPSSIIFFVQSVWHHKSPNLCASDLRPAVQIFLLHGTLTGSQYSWMCAHPVGTHGMFYASVKARIDWHSVNSGFACMSCLVTLLGHRFLFERDTLLSLFMFAILVRSYSLQYNQHKCVKISLLNLLHSKVWIHADPQQTVFPRTTALPLVFQCNFGGLDKMSKCKVIMIYVKDSVTSLPILRLIKSSTRVSVKFVQDGSCRDIW